MKCPACEWPLTSLDAGSVTVDICKGGCGGIWFDNFELKKVDEPNEIDGKTLLEIERDETRLVDTNQRRRCPKCGDVVLMRHFYSDKRDVEVDTCPGCGGIWLDPGELAQIRREMGERDDPAEVARDYFSRLFGRGTTPYGRSGASGI